jgi:carbonic anhydrase
METLATAIDEVYCQFAEFMLRLSNDLDDFAVKLLSMRPRWKPFDARFEVYERALRDLRPNEKTLTIQCIDCRIRGLPESVFNCRSLGAVPLAASVGAAISLLNPERIHVQAHTNCAWLKAVQSGRATEGAQGRAAAAEETRQILGDLAGLDLDDLDVVRELAEKMRRHVASLVDVTRTRVTASAIRI